MTDHLMVHVERVGVPAERGAYPSSILIGEGTLPNGRRVQWAGEMRSMLDLADALRNASRAIGEVGVIAVIEDWQVLAPPGEVSHVCVCGHDLRLHERPAGPRDPWGGCFTCACREAWVVEVPFA